METGLDSSTCKDLMVSTTLIDALVIPLRCNTRYLQGHGQSRDTTRHDLSKQAWPSGCPTAHRAEMYEDDRYLVNLSIPPGGASRYGKLNLHSNATRAGLASTEP